MNVRNSPIFEARGFPFFTLHEAMHAAIIIEVQR